MPAIYLGTIDKGKHSVVEARLVDKPRETQSIPDLIIELIELANAYVRQEVGATVESKVARPIRKAGKWLALACVASTLFALAIIFLAVGSFQLLAQLVAAPWIAYLIIGGILLLGGIGTSVAMVVGKDTD